MTNEGKINCNEVRTELRSQKSTMFELETQLSYKLSSLDQISEQNCQKLCSFIGYIPLPQLSYDCYELFDEQPSNLYAMQIVKQLKIRDKILFDYFYWLPVSDVRRRLTCDMH
jgi:hypothetical protein